MASLLLAAWSAHADTGSKPGWRCVAPTATAYQREEGQDHERWNTIVFAVADQRFVVRSVAHGGWELVHDVQPKRVYPCAGDFEDSGLLRCGEGDQFEMNRRTLAFTSHLFSADAAPVSELVAATVTGSCRPL